MFNSKLVISFFGDKMCSLRSNVSKIIYIFYFCFLVGVLLRGFKIIDIVFVASHIFHVW